MTRRDRWEAALALAMLPVGVALALVSALAASLFLVLAVAALFAMGEAAAWWWPVLCLVAGAALVRATVRSIEIVSALDWRPVPRVLAVWAAVSAPLWWW